MARPRIRRPTSPPPWPGPRRRGWWTSPTPRPTARSAPSSWPRPTAGLVRLAFAREDDDEVLGQLAERVSPRVLEAPDRLDEVRRELDEYFDGRREHFELPLDWRLSAGFRKTVLETLYARRRLRTDGELPGAGHDGREPEGEPRRRYGDGDQPDPDRGPVPPRAPHRWPARRLRRRPPRQGQAPRARGQSLF